MLGFEWSCDMTAQIQQTKSTKSKELPAMRANTMTNSSCKRNHSTSHLAYNRVLGSPLRNPVKQAW
jgi:hypothetical protein